MARLLYFASLVDRLGRATEEVQLPDAITDVRTLLAWLRTRGQPWAQVLRDDAVRVTVNKQFVTLDMGGYNIRTKSRSFLHALLDRSPTAAVNSTT